MRYRSRTLSTADGQALRGIALRRSGWERYNDDAYAHQRQVIINISLTIVTVVSLLLLSRVLAEGFPWARLLISLHRVPHHLVWQSLLSHGEGDIGMWKSITLGLFGCFVLCTNALAQSCSGATYTTLTNGNVADASQVMGNFTCVLSSPSFSGPVTVGTTSTSRLMVGLSTNQDGASVQTYGPASIGWGTGGNISGVSGYNGLHIAGRADSAADVSQVQFGDNVNANSLQFAIANGRASPGELEFWVSNAVNTNPLVSGNMAMVISRSSYVGINTSSPGYTLHVNGSVAGTSAYNNLSDQRLKKNIRPITGALSIIERLSGVRFDWKSKDERVVGKSADVPVGAPQVGFIAQEVEKVLPEAVSTANGPDALKSVAESKVVPVLLEALKELKAANDNQAAEINQLKTEVGALERKAGVRTAQR